MMDNLIPLYLYTGCRIGRPERLYDYILAGQGIVKRLETWYVSADTLLVPIEERLIGLPLKPYPLQPLTLKAPRIPGRLLQDVLADARSNVTLEFIYHFRYASSGWCVTRPEQTGARASVDYYAGPDQADIVLELHSHNTMAAFFSPTDDRDEQGGRFYAVLGRVDQNRPELVLRLGMHGHWLRNIPGPALFDDLGPVVDTYDEYPAVEYGGGRRWSFSNLFRR